MTNEVINHGDYSEILLSNGGSALIDTEDLPKLQGYRWYKKIRNDRPMTYVYGALLGNQTKKVFMHILLLPKENGLQTDHKNGNELDNRKKNLRRVTGTQNCQNRRRLRSDNTSGYRGVSKIKSGKFIATIHVNDKDIRIGTFFTAKEAAIAYNKAAQEHFGEYACLNVIPE